VASSSPPGAAALAISLPRVGSAVAGIALYRADDADERPMPVRLVLVADDWLRTTCYLRRADGATPVLKSA